MDASFAVIITCGTNSFYDESESAAEAFLRAGTPGSPKGAVASIGTSTTGTHTVFNNVVDAGIFEGIFLNDIFFAGSALMHGKLALFNNFPNNTSNKVAINTHWNNLMGDAALELWTDIPDNMTVIHDPEIPYGSNFMDIAVQDGGLPLKMPG